MSAHIDSLKLASDPVITNIAQGVSNFGFVSDLLLPEINVSKPTGKYPIFSAEHMKIHEAERAYKDPKVKTMPTEDMSFGTFNLKEYGLDIVIDHLEIEAAQDLVNLEQYYTEKVMESLKLSQEYQRVTLLQNTANYASGHSETLSGNDIWDDVDSKPLEQIKDAISTIRSKTAQYPNILVLGLDSYNALQEHSSLIEKMKYSQLAVVTEDLIASMISTKENPIQVVVGAGMYKDPISGEMKDLWGDIAILACVTNKKREQRNKYESSFGYTFTMSGYPYGGRAATEYGLTTKVAAFMRYQAAITKNTAGYLFKNTRT